MKQLTLAVGNGFEKHGRATCKAEFLSRMEGLMLWAEFCALIEPHYPKAVNVEPLLPANAPVLAALMLPDFYAITHAGEIGVAAQLDALAEGAARPDFPLVAASCHTRAELDRAARLGCDFVVFGPVRATATHPGRAGIGWDGLAAQLAVPPAPTFALGGLSRDDLDAARAAGAHGIAAIRAAWDE